MAVSQTEKVYVRKLINGKVYDTSKAELMYNDRGNYRQFYRTAKGNWFVVYLRTFDGYEIVPISEEDAKSWIMNLDLDVYIEIWGEEGLEEA